MKAFVLCGGLGTRIKSVSRSLPKCLLTVHDRPFLFYILNLLHSKGIREIILCTGYGHEHVVEKIGNSYKNLEIAYSKEEKPLGTGGAIIQALNKDDGEQFLVLNGDSYCDFDLPPKKVSQSITSYIFVHEVPDVSRYGEVKVFSNSNQVKSFEEKNANKHEGFINAGIYLFNRNVFGSYKANQKISLEKDILPHELGNLESIRCNHGFIDIGTPLSYLEASEFFAKKKLI